MMVNEATCVGCKTPLEGNGVCPYEEHARRKDGRDGHGGDVARADRGGTEWGAHLAMDRARHLQALQAARGRDLHAPASHHERVGGPILAPVDAMPAVPGLADQRCVVYQPRLRTAVPPPARPRPSAMLTEWSRASDRRHLAPLARRSPSFTCGHACARTSRRRMRRWTGSTTLPGSAKRSFARQRMHASHAHVGASALYRKQAAATVVTDAFQGPTQPQHAGAAVSL